MSRFETPRYGEAERLEECEKFVMILTGERDPRNAAVVAGNKPRADARSMAEGATRHEPRTTAH